MGFVDVSGLRHHLPDGRLLFQDVSFRVGEGATVALVGANGAGKTTLLRLVAGDLRPDAGTISSAGGIGVMRQHIGSIRDTSTVRELLRSVASTPLRRAGAELAAAEAALAAAPGNDRAGLDYAQAVSDWAEAGGYEAEVMWGACTVSALAQPFDDAAERPVHELSGGEQKRLALEALLRGGDAVLLLDEPDNALDVAGKRWLEGALRTTTKTVLFVSHDRELLAQTATQVITLEAHSTWVHGGGFAGYPQARAARVERLDMQHRRWEEEHVRLMALVRTLQQQAARSAEMASRYSAMQTRLRKFEEAGPPAERPREQDVRMRLRGGRTGVRALTCERLSLDGLTRSFDLEVAFGERIGVLGANGTGKSCFLRLLGGEDVAHHGSASLGARVVPGWFAQTDERTELLDRTLVESLWHHGLDRGRAFTALRRYELQEQGDYRFSSLSGGQRARFQVLLLELGGATLLLLDEPTDNLDLHSAEALQSALGAFEGTVLAVTHDRWFARSFDRFLVFGADGEVRLADAPVWDEDDRTRLRRRRRPAQPSAIG